MKQNKLTITVNGKRHSLKIAPNLRLIDLLRDVLRLTGTKEGCGIGECGACTVLLDGRAVNSCLVLAGQCEGREIVTIEGLSDQDRIHPIQQSFIDHGAVQCGFCTPGMIMSALALLDQNPSPTEEEIRIAISGNLCRCTGYTQIVEAIKAVAE
ncbi:MAG: (2Fe-2S)-binding protein [PVC group bacterium]